MFDELLLVGGAMIVLGLSGFFAALRYASQASQDSNGPVIAGLVCSSLGGVGSGIVGTSVLIHFCQ